VRWPRAPEERAVKVAAIIQARMGSSRLPGKVLLDLLGHSVLSHVIARVQAARGVDEVVVATTNGRDDDVVASEALRYGARVYRGSADDVLARYRGAALSVQAQAVMRITADCPLLDPELVTAMLTRFRGRAEAGGGLDYLSNGLVRTYPRGLDAEIFTAAALERCHAQAVRPHEREHVTPYIYGNPALFSIEAYIGTPDRSAHRWTLDTPEDWQLIESIFHNLGNGRTIFPTSSVLSLLEKQPELIGLNARVQQKAFGEGS
jgi:spore coat polysaccharide biosynthesis protein SpsF